MALRLVLHHKTETLFEQFMSSYTKAWKNPMVAPTLLSPNQIVDKWLQLEWARKKGIVSGLRGDFLEGFFVRFLKLHTQDTREIVHSDELIQWILEFWSQIVEDPILKPMVEYAEDDLVKRVQLATKMARLLLEYELSRPAMGWYDGGESSQRFNIAQKGILDLWAKEEVSQSRYFSPKEPNTTWKGEKLNNLETWQAQLYKRIFVGPESFRAQVQAKNKAAAIERASEVGQDTDIQEVIFTTLPQWIFEIQTEGQGKWNELLKAFGEQNKEMFFWSTGLSLFHRQLIMDMACYSNVFVYQLNPCATFWEDVKTTQSPKKGAKFGNEMAKATSSPADFLISSQEEWTALDNFDWEENCLLETPDQKLLERWGHIGKENIALWSQMVNYDESSLEEPEFVQPQTLLEGVQQTIIHRAAELEEKLTFENLEQDSSLVVVEAPGLRREIEILRAHILRFLQKNPGVNLDQIGVFAPDPTIYKPYFAQVFDAVDYKDPLYIPYRFVDESAGDSDFAMALQDLLVLWDQNRFDRKAVFAFLRHSIVMNAKGYSPEQINSWEAWAEETNVFVGFDLDHRKASGEKQADASHSFRYALDRMLLDGVLGDDFNELPVWGDRESKDLDNLGTFVNLIESLWADLNILQDLEGKPWGSSFETLKSVFLNWLDCNVPFNSILDEITQKRVEAESSVEASLNDLLNTLRNCEREFRLKEFQTLVKGHLEQELPARKSLFGGSLMVMGLRDGRPIPWQAVFVVGMGEGEFPGSSKPDAMDLRLLSPKPGDSNPTRQAKYIFLELLMCARSHLYISWDAHDLAKDTEKMPSSIILELEDFVVDTLIGSNGYDNYVKNKRLSYSVQLEDDIESNKNIPGRVATNPVESNYQFPAQKTSVSVEDQSEVPGVKHLVSFLKNPLEATLTRNLGLWSEEEGDSTQKTDEPLGFDILPNAIFKLDVIKEWKKTWGTAVESDASSALCQSYSSLGKVCTSAALKSFESQFESVWDVWQKKGACPSGIAGVELKSSLNTATEAILENVAKKLENESSSEVEPSLKWLWPWRVESLELVDISKGNASLLGYSECDSEGVLKLHFTEVSASKLKPVKLTELYLQSWILAYKLLVLEETEISSGIPLKNKIQKIEVNACWVNHEGVSEIGIAIWDLESAKNLEEFLDIMKNPLWQNFQAPLEAFWEIEKDTQRLSRKDLSIDELQDWIEVEKGKDGPNDRPDWYPKEVSLLPKNSISPTDEELEAALKISFVGIDNLAQKEDK